MRHTHDDNGPLVGRAVRQNRADDGETDPAAHEQDGAPLGAVGGEPAVRALEDNPGTRRHSRHLVGSVAAQLDGESQHTIAGARRQRDRMGLPPQVRGHHAQQEELTGAGVAQASTSGGHLDRHRSPGDGCHRGDRGAAGRDRGNEPSESGPDDHGTGSDEERDPPPVAHGSRRREVGAERQLVAEAEQDRQVAGDVDTQPHLVGHAGADATPTGAGHSQEQDSCCRRGDHPC